MAAGSQRDVVDYFDDNTQNENDTAFIPVRRGRFPDSWSGFFGGILIGAAGGALMTLAPWLGGLLVFAGYSLTAMMLRRSRNPFPRALSFGFIVLALAGAAIFLGVVLLPETTSAFLAAAAARHAILISVVTLAWLIGLVRYIYIRLFL